MTWNGSEASDFYIVTAETNSGHKVQLSTNETWTFISEFHCGRVYYLSVQAVDSECTSRPSRPSELQTGRMYSMNLFVEEFRRVGTCQKPTRGLKEHLDHQWD